MVPPFGKNLNLTVFGPTRTLKIQGVVHKLEDLSSEWADRLRRAVVTINEFLQCQRQKEKFYLQTIKHSHNQNRNIKGISFQYKILDPNLTYQNSESQLVLKVIQVAGI